MTDVEELKRISPARLNEAVTHSSTGESVHNERLEFLGDSVLSLVISEWLYARDCTYSEGRMSQIRAAVVRENTLAAVARKLKLGSLLRLGKGEEKTGGRNRASLLADSLEAVLAAMFLDLGLERTRTFILEHFEPQLFKACAVDYISDYKSQFQEKMQASGLEPIEYTVTKDSGPDHNKTFWVEVSVQGRVLASGSGKTKKQAEQEAAREALSIDFEP